MVLGTTEPRKRGTIRPRKPQAANREPPVWGDALCAPLPFSSWSGRNGDTVSK